LSLAGFLFRYFRAYRIWLALAFVGVFSYALFSGAMVLLIEPIFGEVLLHRDAKIAGVALTSAATVAADPAKTDILERRKLRLKRATDRGYLWLKRRFAIDENNVVVFVPVLFVLVFVVRSVADFLSGYAFQRIGLGATTDIRNELYARLLAQSSRFHAAHPSGELLSRVVNDVAMMQNAISMRLLDLFQQSVTLLLYAALLVSTNARLAFLCLVAAPALLFPIVRFGQGMRRTSHRSQERLADLANLVAEGVRGHRVVKAFGAERFEDRRFREATGRHLKVNLWSQILASLSGPVVETAAVCAGAGLLVYAGFAIRAGSLSSAELVGFLGNLAFMYDPVRRLNKVNLILQQSLAAVQRVKSVMEIPNDIQDRAGAVGLTGFSDSIRYEAVQFAYDSVAAGGKPVLLGVDLRVRRGEIVALVGPSGGGKSTLVNLLPRFFDPDAGRVAIDGRDLRDIRLADLRALIGVVTQETLLFNDTVRANIAYGHPEVSMERVQSAAVAACADEFIRQLPDGYDTLIGESGLRLSGGQRQRLAIARAILKDAPILILDEATSQLDSESEALVQNALHNLMQGRTTLVIAHRLATVQKADRIVVIEAGRIVEEGTHAELLQGGGLYKRLYDLQFLG
jgi:ATP-binding cassette, subfamily B, bacterial MsbA